MSSDDSTFADGFYSYLQYTTIMFNFQKFSDRFIGDLGASLLLCIILTSAAYFFHIRTIAGITKTQSFLYTLIVFLFFHMTYSMFSFALWNGFLTEPNNRYKVTDTDLGSY